MSTLLVIFSFLLPFLPALNVSESFDLASSRLIIVGFLGIWVVWSLIRGTFRIPFGWVSLMVLLFLAWILFSFLYTPVFERTLRKIMVFYSIFPLYFVAYGLFYKHGEKLVKKVVRAVSFSTFGVAFWGLLQFLAQFLVGKEGVAVLYEDYLGPLLWGGSAARAVKDNPSWLFDAGGADVLRAFATLPDPHMLSYFLALGLGLTVALGFVEKDKKIKLFCFITAFLGLLVEVLTFSRGGYLGFFVGLFLAGLAIFWRKIKLKQLLGGLVGFAVLIFLIRAVPDNPVSNRIGSTFNVFEGSNQGRIKIWQEAWRLFRENPWLGVGLGAYSFEIKPYADYREPVYAHNLYLEFLSELGVLGLVFWLGMIAGAGWVLLKAFFRKQKTGLEPVFLALAVFLAWFSVHSFFEMPVYSPVILPLLVLVLAISSWVEDGKKNEEED